MKPVFIAWILFLPVTPSSGAAEFPEILNPKGCTFNDMERFYLRELGIKNARIEYVRKLITDPATKGYIRPISKGEYRIVLDKYLEPSEIRITLAHELVHVRQLEQGQIDHREFDKHYLERSFEDEAFRLSLPMAARFYTEMDCSPKK